MPLTDILWDKGQLAAIDISSITAQERLSIDDVDADASKATRQIVRLGTKHLFHKEMLDPLRRAEGAARQALYLYSASFPIGSLRFVTNESLPNLEDKLEDIKGNHAAAITGLQNNFYSYRDAMLQTYSDQLRVEDYVRTERLLFSGRCQIRFSTFKIDFKNVSEEAQLLTDFTKQSIIDLRETLGAAAAKIAQRLADGTPISEKSLNAMRRLVQRTQDANFMDDPVTNELVDTLKAELDNRTARELRLDSWQADVFRLSLQSIAEAANQISDAPDVSRAFLGTRYLEEGQKEEVKEEPRLVGPRIGARRRLDI